MRSRLTERLETRTKRNIILTVIGMTIIVGLLWKFGVPILATMSYMIAGSKTDDEIAQKSAYVAPPILNDTYDATNSARVTISGSSITGDTTIALYVNNAKVDATEVNTDNTFSFDTIPLDSGENTIKVQAVTKTNQKSEFSNTVTISYLDKEPSLSIDSPSDGTQFHKDEKSIDIKGKTDAGARVTVNDFWAIVDADGNYTYTMPLKDGDNDIKVVATDEAGNKAEKQIRVNYSQ
ncbi:MAG: hypothetical protein KBD46_02740 [Candidatus Levybacteria bacterium]|nr:hypothetical protein [Candidatus Levybacteria bacterium]